MKVNIIGPAFGTSGFANHIKQLATALHERSVEVRLDSPKPDNWLTMVNDAELVMHNREFSKEMTSILVGQPQFLPFAWADNPKTVIPFVIWEGDKVPQFWMKHLLDERIKQIWVPSTHVKDAILNTGIGGGEQLDLSEKIKIVPHGVDLSIFQPNPEQKERNFTFLANKGWAQGINDRGGIQWLLKAFHAEFSNTESVELRIKINTTYCPPGWDFNVEMKKLGIEKKEDSPSILVSTDNVEQKLMAQFYEGDVFVSPTMGEAFNLPCIEAMACGVPVITTNFGGQTDFVTQENGWLVDGKLVDVTWDMPYEGVKWMQPDVDELRKTMRDCFENKKVVDEKGREAAINAIEWTWAKSAEKAMEHLRELTNKS